MTYTITVNLPESVYRQLRQAADQTRRPFDDVLVEAITAAVPGKDVNISGWRADLAQLAYLNDAALWQAARAAMSEAQRDRLEALHHQQQRAALSREETDEMKVLETLYRDTILVRAQAAVLLNQRGYDTSNPSQFAPLA